MKRTAVLKTTPLAYDVFLPLSVYVVELPETATFSVTKSGAQFPVSL